MFKAFRHSVLAAAAMSAALLVSTAPAASADLGRAYTPEPVAAISPWTFTFTAYGWVPWLSGNMTVKGRTFDVQVDTIEMLDHLNWSTLPAWMSYAEARNGPISLFNDIVYANVTGSKDFARLPSASAGVSVDYEQATVEFGGAYQVLSGPNPALAGSAALDLLAGGRYWHQEVNANVKLGLGEIDRSGSVDWVDPFVGARLRQRLVAGEIPHAACRRWRLRSRQRLLLAGARHL